MLSDKLANINLLPTYERQSKTGYILFIGLIIIVILGYLLVGVDYFTTKKSLETAQSKHSTIQIEVDALNAQLVALQDVGPADTLSDAVFFVENYNYPTSRIIRELVSFLPDTAYLSDYSYSTLTVTVENHFEALDDLADYTSSLTASKYINDARVNSVVTQGFKELDGDEKDLYFNTIPRYHGIFSLDIDKRALREGADIGE